MKAHPTLWLFCVWSPATPMGMPWEYVDCKIARGPDTISIRPSSNSSTAGHTAVLDLVLLRPFFR